jgi:cyclopropane-fatty-acyl-phospholipid synthase
LNAQDTLAEDAAPWTARAVFHLLARIQSGSLVLVTPDGVQRSFSGAAAGPHARLEVHDWRAFARIARSAEIGLFDAWRERQVSTPDMTALLRFALRNASALGSVYDASWLTRAALRVSHALRANTRAGSRRNIHAHYDLGNAFYSLWLDSTMSYSSALFHMPGQDLALAQHAKYDRILDQLAVNPGDRVLEIGCGWGGFAERAAARGCEVTGVTISQAQLAYAKQRIERAGLANRVDLRFLDYRDLSDTFDHIVSIEMVEAVGERYWPVYFRTLRDRLVPGGRAMLQSIVVADDAFDAYRRSSDFIRERVFPGGMLPSMRRLREEADRAGLEVGAPFHFGRHYAETLRRWRHAFEAAASEIRALGFDDAFFATWRFYLDYCEAGFEEGRVDVVQVQLARP